MELAVALFGILLGVAFLVYMVKAHSPELRADHERPPADAARPTTADDLYRGTDTPAGPDAEEQQPVPPGEPPSK